MTTYMLPKSQRSPKEEYRYSNYPELALVDDAMSTLFAYFETLQSALSGYYDEEETKININIAELRNMLLLSYEITDTLGRADNICFDVLMNIRSIQLTMNDLLYVYLSTGNDVVQDTNGKVEMEAEEEGMV